MAGGIGWIETVEPGIGDEERVRVPERQNELPADLVQRLVAEIQVVARIDRGEEPAHDIDAGDLGGVVEPDRIALALVHLLALFVAHEGVGEDVFEGGAIGQCSALGDDRIEPVAELAGEALGNKIGGIPLLPVRLVGAVVQGRESHDAGIEPGIAYIFDARDGRAASLAGDLDAVDPRAMGRVALEVVPAFDSACLSARLREPMTSKVPHDSHS